jgi:hypothetical protein
LFGRKPIRLVSVILWLAMSVLPSVAQAQALEEVSVKRLADTAKIRVRFSAPVQVKRFFPERSGEILYISIRLTQLGDPDDVARRQRISSIDRLGGDLPLNDVTFEPNTAEGDRIILRFSRTMSYKLQRGRDGRSIVILVPIEKKASEPTGAVNESFPYVVNLDSKRTPISSVKLLPVDTDNFRVYVSQYKKDNSLWYRLRLGFFPNKNAALEAVERVRLVYPKAWVTRVSQAERVASRKLVVTTQAPAATPPGKDAELEQQMKTGRQALIRGDNKTAITIFNKLSRSGDSRYNRDALELLGLSYEREGDRKRASKIYQQYIRTYPRGDATTRVKQRLANLSRFGEREPLRAAKPARKPGDLEYYGTWSQRWYTGTTSTDGSSSVDQSALLSNLYVNARFSSDNVKYRANLNVDHTLDSISDTATKGDVRHAFVEAKAKSKRYEAKLGRQSGSARGILARFDGVIGGFNLYRDWHLYLASGAPVDTVAPDSERRFQGVSVDTRIPSNDLSLTVFNMDATIDGEPDRKAIGMEGRFSTSDISSFGLLDYDTYFNDLNILLLQSNWKGSKDLTYNLLVDYRKSPLMQLSNALLAPVNGVTYESIAALRAAQPGVDVYQVAKDRTATSRLVSGGITRALSKRVQLSGDISMSEVSGVPASEGQAAVPGTGLLTTVSGRIIASDWLAKNSVSVAGVSLVDASTYNALSMFVTERATFKRDWRIEANVSVYLVNNDIGTSQVRLTPALRTEYRRKKVTFEFELGQEVVDNSGTLVSSTDRTFVMLGYRYDF